MKKLTESYPTIRTAIGNAARGRGLSVRSLIQPSGAVQGAENIRKAQLLSAMLLLFTPLPFIALFVRLLTDPAFKMSPVSVVGIIVLAVLYRLSRTRHYFLIAVVLVSIFPIGIFSISLTNYSADDFKMLLMYLGVGAILSSMLLTRRVTIIYCFVSLNGIMLLPVLIPEVDFRTIFSPMTIFIEMSVLLIVAMWHRDLIEADRQAQLMKTNQELEHEIAERKKTQQALQSHTERLEILRGIDQAILASNSPEELAQAALQRLHNLIPFQRARVMLFDFDTMEVTPLAVCSQGESRLNTQLRAPIEAYGVDIDLLRANQVYRVEDIHALPNPPLLVQSLAADGVQAFVSIPLLHKEGLIGAFDLGMSYLGAVEAEYVSMGREIADQLAIAIQQARLFEAVRRHAEELEQRVLERTAELQSANTHLEKLSRAKDEFVSNVSHELRTPITNLLLRQHLLQRNPDQLQKHLEVIGRETKRLEHTIEDLLQLSRLDQGRVELQLEWIDLNGLVNQHVGDRALLMQQKDLSLTFVPESELPLVCVDQGLLGHVLSILLTNAMNYTLPGGKVVAGTHLESVDGMQWAGFSVSDTGLGILPEEQANLFRRFFRGSAGRESRAPGTGLGLAIAKEIIDRHAGRIEVKSAGVPGLGTLFSVWLPVEIMSQETSSVFIISADEESVSAAGP